MLEEDYLERIESSNEDFNTYLHGDCHIFAQTLQELFTSWTLVAYYDSLNEDGEEVTPFLIHTGLYKEGVWLDVRGECKSEEEFLEPFDYTETVELRGVKAEDFLNQLHAATVEQLPEILWFIQENKEHFTKLLGTGDEGANANVRTPAKLKCLVEQYNQIPAGNIALHNLYELRGVRIEELPETPEAEKRIDTENISEEHIVLSYNIDGGYKVLFGEQFIREAIARNQKHIVAWVGVGVPDYSLED